jgi:hypothetical protein
MTYPDAQPAPTADRLLSALRDGKLDDAGQILSTAQPPVSGETLRPMAEMLMRRRQWAQAAWLFGRLPAADRDVAVEMKQRLASNLAALQIHRPAVYEALVALPAQQQFSVGGTPSGKPTVNFRRPDGSLVSLSSGPDPLAAAGAAVPKLYEQTPGGEAVAVCGFGDGYVAQVLAHNPPRLFMDTRQPIYLIEPEPQIVLQCLMIHDYTGPAGPIEQARFRWFVGAGWDKQLERELADDAYLPCPVVTVAQGFNTPQIQARLTAILHHQVERIRVLVAEVEGYYASLTPGHLAELFAGAGARPPRVLLLTTRFSTVLQYSTRDTAAAFERMGWEARVMIEPTPHHRILRGAMAAVMAEFRPDLVFQIDHLRHEHRGLFPANLPFACWIQDHLPHLASREVGAQVGELDFVLTDSIATYVDKFAYPARQCVPLPKLVVPAEPVEVGQGDEGRPDDLVFVSNASHNPEAMVAEAVHRFARNPQTHELVVRCCRRMIDTYARGDSLPTYHHVCAVLRQTLDEHGLSLPPDGFDVLARWMTHPFNDALYRQQALRWAADAAREQGLTLSLYGKGWESHPEFAPYARGPVAYGEPLRRLTRRSRINLQIVPYLCLHQRLLDGLLAGGFFLIRTHPADLSPAALLDFVDAHAGPTARATADAVAAVPAAQRDVLAALIAACRPSMCTTGAEDVVAMVRDWQESGQLVSGAGPLPMLDDVGFHDAASLSGRVRRFVADVPLRESVNAAQRRSVGGRLSYDAGVRRVVERISGLLADTAGSAAGRQRVSGIPAEVLAA